MSILDYWSRVFSWSKENFNFDLWNKVSQRITRNGSDVHIDYRRTAVGCQSIGRIAMEFDRDEYQKFKYHRYVQKLYVPTLLRAPITILEQTQTFSIKHSTFVSSFKMWRNSIYLKRILIKNLNHILNHAI